MPKNFAKIKAPILKLRQNQSTHLCHHSGFYPIFHPSHRIPLHDWRRNVGHIDRKQQIRADQQNLQTLQ
jgi:hypothetical protein